MNRSFAVASLLPAALLGLFLTGCGPAPSGPSQPAGGAGGEVWAEPVQVPLLAPLEGKWKFDQERTLEVRQAQGMSAEEIQRHREMIARAQSMKLPADVERTLRAQGIDPVEIQASLGRMHPDMNVQGHVATCAGMPSAEYRFFGLHEHGGKVCGKAWHHEDRFDPGDMSKCYVRLALVEDELHMELKMKDGLPDLNDPDLMASQSPMVTSADKCDADSPGGADWGEWSTYVFVRPTKAEPGQR